MLLQSKREIDCQWSVTFLLPTNTGLKCYNSELVTEFPMLVCLCFREKPEEIIVRPLVSNLPHPVLYQRYHHSTVGRLCICPKRTCNSLNSLYIIYVFKL